MQLQTIDLESRPEDWSWSFWPLVPIYPYRQRRTLCQEVVKDTVWTFDQAQGIFYVVVPIRMTVVRLQAGGLLVYAPIAPTKECIRLMRSLVAQHGDVKYIILPTVSGLEHKVFVGPFARQFPQAEIFVAPNQWSFPLNLPLPWLGFPANRTKILPANPQAAPFSDEFDYAILDVDLKQRSFGEVALYHKSSQTLLVADSVLSVSAEPPAIVQLDPYPMLFHARDDAFEPVQDTEANRQKGWRRIALFAFYFQPHALDTIPLPQAFRDAAKASDRSRRAYFGIYPFRWKENWERSFETLSGGGRLFVAPILQALILNRAPQSVLDWADQVASWDFERIIPCHLDSPIVANSSQFRAAFTFLEKAANQTDLLPDEDFEFLMQLNTGLTKRGITPPAQERV